MRKFYYQSSGGEIVSFHENENLFASENGLLSHEWETEDLNDRIASLSKRGVKERSFDGLFLGSTSNECMEERKRVCQLFDEDIINQSPGRIYIGDNFLNCYINKVEITSVSRDMKSMKATFGIVFDDSNWHREVPYFFDEEETKIVDDWVLAYPRGYPMGYSLEAYAASMQNTGKLPASMILEVYGPVSSPGIYIGGKLYAVDVNLRENERLLVNQLDRTIVKIYEDGQKQSFFANRRSGIFEPLPSGELVVAWLQKCSFKIDLIESYSSPYWRET